MTQDIYTLDPERITDRIFGGPHFLKLKVVQTSPLICKHPISGRVYTMDEIGVASWESRNARPAIYAGPLAGIPWHLPEWANK